MTLIILVSSFVAGEQRLKLPLAFRASRRTIHLNAAQHRSLGVPALNGSRALTWEEVEGSCLLRFIT